jgi:non-canonical purine NTP pyrophosphatase (RdgB/HAM1 family)
MAKKLCKKLYYVTSNSGKFQEVSTYLSEHCPHIELEQLDFDIEEIQTDDQMKIAIDKAKKAWNFAKKPLLIDDAAIYFNRYTKFPGTMSKFVSLGMGFEGIKRIFDEGDKAYLLLYMVYIDGPESYKVFEGRCDGYLTKPKTFDAHPNLPYDAYFVPDNEKLTYAQIRNTPLAAKYLYRLQALKKFLEWYQPTTYADKN